ncbi:hypothetical protein [Pseudoalteromonas sp. T1lg22]|uniref:hypothetical protein n=1 Tax=Pseudoalteromonas sp. T1lg22 TaxID=2077096 RepID=UPI00131A02E4|nr:hypothetical protein [Pseudoalteromonas sp. T1lg22]
MTIDNDSSLILTSFIKLSPGGANKLYLTCSALFASISLVAFFNIFKSITSKNQLLLTEKYIQAPKTPTSNKIVIVDFENINNYTETSVKGNRFLNIYHDGGTLRIQASSLPKKGDFKHVKSHILSRISF